MNEVDKIVAKIKSMSSYNPLMDIFIDYLKAVLNEPHSKQSNKEEILREALNCKQQIQEIDEFSISCIRRFFSQNQMTYMNIPYCRYLEERMNMMEFYKESGVKGLNKEMYVYEEAIPEVIALLQELSEDSWWILTWIEEYLIIAKKMDLIDFTKDPNLDLFFQIKDTVLKLESETILKLSNSNLLNVFGEASVGADKLKARKCEILKKFLLGDDLRTEISELNQATVDNDNFIMQIGLRSYIDELLSPINLYKYLGLYKSDHRWLYAFPTELVEELRKLISDIFKQPDAETLANGLSEYLIIKDLSNDKVPNPKKIIEKCFPFHVEEKEINSKIDFFKKMIRRSEANGEN